MFPIWDKHHQGTRRQRSSLRPGSLWQNRYWQFNSSPLGGRMTMTVVVVDLNPARVYP